MSSEPTQFARAGGFRSGGIVKADERGHRLVNDAVVKPFNVGTRQSSLNGAISVFADVIGYWS